MGKCGLGISVWDGARVIEAQVDGWEKANYVGFCSLNQRFR